MDFLRLMDLVDPIQLCPDCLVIRTPRSRHCTTCNRCVERFDHHCPWINNCVGINNHMWFMMFLVSLICTICIVSTGTMMALLDVNREQNIDRAKLFYELLPDEYPVDTWVFNVASYLVLGICFTFLLPVLFLFYIQLSGFCMNRTTNERFSRKKVRKVERVDSTGSSLMSTTTSLAAEDLIREMGAPTDYSDRCLPCIHNQLEMGCSKKAPAQMEIYDALVRNKEGSGSVTHLGSINDSLLDEESGDST